MWYSSSQTAVDGTWLCFCFSVLVFPLFPALGALGLIIVLLRVWQANFNSIINSSLNRGLAILAVLMTISSALAEQSIPAWLGLANFVPFFALFAALRCTIAHPVRLTQLSWLLVLPSLPIVILGFGQLFVNWDTPELIESILGWQLVPLGIPPGRMSAVFIYANFLAIYLAIAFCLTLGLWLDWQTKHKLNRRSIYTLVLLTTILFADLGGLVLTSSRNAWGLVFISFMAYAVYLGWRWLVWGVTAAATVILWASFAPNLGGEQLRTVVPAFIWARLSDRMYPDRPIETLRITQWQFCWDLIKERPWWGWGLRNFTPLYEAKTSFWFGHPHNLFLMLSAEIGIVAVLLLLAIIGSIMISATRLLLNDGKPKLILFSYIVAFTSCIIFNLTDVSIFDLRVNTISWILLAAISGVATKSKQSGKISKAIV